MLSAIFYMRNNEKEKRFSSLEKKKVAEGAYDKDLSEIERINRKR